MVSSDRQHRLRKLILSLALIGLAGAFVADGVSVQAQQPRAVRASDYENDEVPESQIAHAPEMTKEQKDELLLKIIVAGAAVVGFIAAIIVWRVNSPASDHAAATNPTNQVNGTEPNATATMIAGSQPASIGPATHSEGASGEQGAEGASVTSTESAQPGDDV